MNFTQPAAAWGVSRLLQRRRRRSTRAGMKLLFFLPFLVLGGCAVPAEGPEAAIVPEPAVAVASAGGAAVLPAGGRLVGERCAGCHGLDVALSGPRSAEQWREVLDVMVGHGLVATDEELRLMHSYLAEQR